MALKEVLAAFQISVQGLQQLTQAGKAVDDTAKKAISLEDAFRQIAGGLGLALGAGAVVAWVGQISDAADAVGDLAGIAGTTAQTLQGLQYAAELNGATAEDAKLAFKGLSMAMGQAANPTSTQAKLLKQYGIAVKDAAGNALPMETIMGNVGEALKGVEDPLKKAFIAQTLMGEAGGKLVPTMENLAGSMEDFQALGGGFSDESIAAAGRYQDALLRLRVTWAGFQGQLFSQIEPALNRITGLLTTAAAAVRRWSTDTHIFASILIGLIPTIYAVGAAFLAAWGPAIAKASLATAKVLIFALILDDLWAWWEGRPSVFGAILDKMFGEGSSAKIRQWIADVGTIVGGGFSALWALITGDFDAWVDKFGGDVVAAFERIRAQLEKILPEWAVKLLGGTADQREENADRAAKTQAGAAILLDKAAASAMEAPELGYTSAPTYRMGERPGPQTDARTQVVNVTVSGAKDPKAVGSEVANRARGAFDTRAMVAAGVPAR